MKTHSRYNIARRILIFWCLFIGIGAVGGSVGMLSAPDGSNMGMQPLIPFFQVLPFAELLFQDFIFPGIALLVVNGLTNLTAAGLMLAKKRAGIVCGTVFGFTLMAWIVIQFIIFPPNLLSSLYFVFGILQAITGIAALIFYAQEHFAVSMGDYPKIGTDHTRLVVYFSRMGYTRKAAFEEAERTGADVYELRSTERTSGTLGFWWCGRFGMHKWDMTIEDISADIASYDSVTLCTPVWVFHICAPMRSFCRAASGMIKNADYIISHFQRGSYRSAADEMDSLLGISASHVESRCVRYGRVLSRMTLRGEPSGAKPEQGAYRAP